MTTQQLILISCLYLAELVIVTYFTRATARRIAGALAGGATVGALRGSGADTGVGTDGTTTTVESLAPVGPKRGAFT